MVPSRADALRLSDDEVDRAPDAAARGPMDGRDVPDLTLERSDILPVDDYGVREGYRRLKSLDKTPTPRQMRDIGLAWSPHRTVAAWYLWRLPAQGMQPPGDPARASAGMRSHDRHRRHAGRQGLDRHRP